MNPVRKGTRQSPKSSGSNGLGIAGRSRTDGKPVAVLTSGDPYGQQLQPEAILGIPAVILGQGMQKVMQLVKSVAQTDATGLATGQSGVAGEITLAP